MIGYVYLILAKLCGIGKVMAMKACGGIAKGFSNSVRINTLRTAICVVVSLVICLISGFRPATAAGHVLLAMAGLFTAIQLIFWVLAVQGSSVCLVEVVGMLGSVTLPMILSPLLYKNETTSVLQWVGAVLLFLAVWLFSPSGEKGKKISPQQLLLLVMNSIGGGGAVIFQKLYAVYGGGDTAYFNLMSFIVTLAVLGIVRLVLVIRNNRLPEPAKPVRLEKKVLVLIVTAAVFLYGFTFLYTRASGMLPSGVLYPLSYALTMTMTYLIDVLLYHEKVTWKNLTGAGVVIVSMILIGA